MTHVNGPLEYDYEKEVSTTMAGNTTVDHARGDGVKMAGRSLRGLLRQRREYETTRLALVVLCGVLAAAAVAGVVMALVTWDPDPVFITIFAAILAMLGRYVAMMHGASIMIGNAAVTLGVTVWAGFAGDLHWIAAAVVALVILATLQPLTSRKNRLPLTPTGVICQWVMALSAVAAQWATVGIVAIAAVVVLAVTLIQCDVLGYLSYRAACRRSGIPAKLTRISKRKVGLAMPGAMTRDNINAGIEAEKATAEQLDSLGSEYVVLHSRSIPGSDADIDHLVIGPHGVAVVDSKYRTGTMELRERFAAGSVDDRNRKAREAASVAAEVAPEHVPDALLDEHALVARQDAHDANIAALFGEESWPEWYLNGAPANAALMSSAAWETGRVEEALLVPTGGDWELPCILSIYGARMSNEMAVVPTFNDDGVVDRMVSTVQYTAVPDHIRSLPEKIGSPQMVDDLATVVDYLFPRKG